MTRQITRLNITDSSEYITPKRESDYERIATTQDNS